MTLPAIKNEALIPLNAKKDQHGLKAEYFNNKEVQGKPVLTRIDKNIDFNWRRESPAPGIVNLDKWSVRWTGELIAPGTGVYEIGVNADNGVRIYVNDKLIVDAWSTASPDRLKSGFIELVNGRKYKLQIEFFENIGDAMAKLGLALRYDPKTEIKKAAEVAQKSDIAIICAGLNKSLEGESYDREKLTLPDDQVSLIKAVTAVNKNTIVVLYNATPILMNEWIDRVPAIIEAFYPGQEGSAALADILFGDINPSGKLPLTFIKSWENSPAFGTYPGAKEIANYTEGIYVGYRHFDKNEIEPLFPFGYGLSYTTFNYSNLEITPNIIKQNGIVTVKVNIQNTGKMAGDEVVQIYLRDIKSSVEREVKALKGFTRVGLKPGESNVVTFELDKSSLAFYDVNLKKWIAEPGKFKVMVGSSSRDIRLESDFELK